MHGQRTNESAVFLSVTKRKNPLIPARYDSVNGVDVGIQRLSICETNKKGNEISDGGDYFL